MEGIKLIDASLMELGAGGLLVVAILKIVFDFAKHRTDSHHAGAMDKLDAAIDKLGDILADVNLQSKLQTEAVRGLSEEVRDMRRGMGAKLI